MWKICVIAKWVVITALLTTVESFLTVRVQINPNFSYFTPSPCTASFVDSMEANLSEMVLNAAHQISFLSDLKIPSGLHLSYFDNFAVRNLRGLFLKKRTTLSTCSSAGCAISLGIAVCNLCGNTGRRLARQSITYVDEDQRRRLANWDVVGVDVSAAVQPLLRSFVANSPDANSCLGNPDQLAVNVTFLSDVPFNVDMEHGLVQAFGAAPLPVPAPSPRACCTNNFATCDSNCGSTETQCQTCSEPGATWLPQGPPNNPYVCIARWGSCLGYTAGCCAGLSCIGDQYQRLCVYASDVSPPPTPSPSPAPPACTTVGNRCSAYTLPCCSGASCRWSGTSTSCM